MTRSSRHTPIIAITTSQSEKRDKRLANRACRRALHVALAGDTIGEALLPVMRDVSDSWTMDKDGKQWLGSKWPHLLRK